MIQFLIEFKGRILDSATKQPILFANIIIKGTKVGVSSDENGYFDLNLDVLGSLKPKRLTLLVKYPGYEDKEIKIEKLVFQWK
jgi:hypothetical protein